MRLSPAFVVTTLLLFGPGLGSSLGACPQDQAAKTTVSEPAHDAAAHEQASPAKEHDHSAMLAAQAAAEPSEIDVLVTKMNKAKGQAKVAIMADLITRLVAEHKASAAHAASASGSAGSAHDASANGGGHDMSCPMCAAHKKSGEHK
jgi:hypothetical protein